MLYEAPPALGLQGHLHFHSIPLIASSGSDYILDHFSKFTIGSNEVFTVSRIVFEVGYRSLGVAFHALSIVGPCSRNDPESKDL